LTNEKPTWCHLLFYFVYCALNMFRTLIYSSSGACDCVDELPHRSSCSQFVVCWSFCYGWYLVVFVLQVLSCVFIYFQFASILHNVKKWLIFSTYCWHNQHVLPFMFSSFLMHIGF
jgi:hypothetical protein